MAWSGRDALLQTFIPRFASKQRCLDSVDKYIKTATALDDDRGHAWVERDLQRDQELATIADPEDTHIGPSRYDLNDCYHCDGRGYVRKDVPVHHADFGKAFRCPACNASDSPSVAEHCDKCRTYAAANAYDGYRNQPRTIQRDYVAELARHMTP